MHCVTLALMVIMAGFAASRLGVAEDPPLELDDVLQRWEAASSETKTFDAKFERIEYDEVFDTTFYSQGSFLFESPNKGRYEIHSEAIDNEMPKPASEIWIWDGVELLQMDDVHRTYGSWKMPTDEEIEAHTNSKGRATLLGIALKSEWNFLGRPQSFLPLVVDIRAADLKRQFELELIRSDEQEIRVSATPRGGLLAESFRRFVVIIDRETYQTCAVKSVGTDGQSKTVHVFADIKINAPIDPEDCRLRPSLDGYRNARTVHKAAANLEKQTFEPGIPFWTIIIHIFLALWLG